MTSVIGFDKPMLMYYKKTTLNNQDMVQHCEFKKNSAGKFLKGSMKSFILFSVLILNVIFASGQSIFTNPITAVDPSLSNPYVAGQTVDANISVSGISRGLGIVGASASNRYSATSWNTAAIDLTAYFEFTLTPAAGCDIDFVSFVYTGQASGTGPTSFAFRSSLDTYATNIGAPTVAGTTISLAAAGYQNVSSTITFRFYGWGASALGGTFSINDFTFNGITACGAPLNTITTGVITGSPFGVTCSTPATGSIAFTSSGTFIAGNNYVAQLSNASGSFASPTIIGSLTSAANSGSISISIPSATATGAGYLIRIISTTPAIISNSSAAFSINLTGAPCVLEPPHLTSVIINSCNGLCSEGNNEIVFGTSGGYSFTANTANFDFLYGSSYPGLNYTDVLVSNATSINELNTAAGCGTLFVDAVGGIVPANANWMLVSTTICAEALTWTGLCGLGPIYVVFQNDASWNLIGGNFVNSPAIGDMRYYQTSITTTLGSTFTIDYTTDDSYPNSDGVFAAFDSNGGAATSYGDNNCILTPTVLPTGLINYNGNYIDSKSQLTWQTASEQNNSHFTLSHSTDGYQFNVIGTVMGAGNSTEIRDYRFIHNYPHPGMNYYKLKSTDYDGKEYSKGIVAIEAEFNFSFYNSVTSTIELSYESDIEIFSMDGKLIQSSLNTSSVPFTKSGMFFIYDKKTGISERLFIP